MQKTAVIYLQAHDLTNPSWMVFDEHHEKEGDVHHGDVSQLTQVAADHYVMVLVPAEDVLLTQVMLPKMSRSRLRMAIPYSLEEQLIDDVQALHFAVGEHHEGKFIPVAIVAQEKMRHWMSLLQSWHIKPDKMVSALLALPFANDAWQVAVEKVAMVRTGETQGFACDVVNMPTLLDAAIKMVTPAPALIHVHQFGAESLALSLAEPIVVKESRHASTTLSDYLASHASQSQGVNLLQGDYAVKKATFPAMTKLWRISFYCLGTWAAVLFLYPTISYLILASRAQQLESDITRIYKQHFPQASNVVAPKLRMSDKLQKLNAEVGENRLLTLLGYIGQGMQQTVSIKLRRFDFQNSQLTIELTAPTSDDFSTFTDYLTQQGLNVKQQNATVAGERINATLQIE